MVFGIVGRAEHIACVAVRTRLFLAHVRLMLAYRVAIYAP